MTTIHTPEDLLKPITVRIPEVIRMTGLGRSTVYELIAAGEIDTAKVGRATVVFLDSVERFLEAGRKPSPGIGLTP